MLSAVEKSTVVLYSLGLLNVTVNVAVVPDSLTVTSLMVKLAGSLSLMVPMPWLSVMVRLASVALFSLALVKLTKNVSVVSVIGSVVRGTVNVCVSVLGVYVNITEVVG